MQETLRNLIAKGKTKQALDTLLATNVADKDVQQRIILLSNRFQIYERKALGNLEDPSVLGVELNEINRALLAIVEELDGNETSTYSPIFKKKGCVISLSVAFAAIIGIFSLPALFNILPKFDRLPGKETLSFVTVLVSDKNGEPVMRQQGNIEMFVTGGENKSQRINDKGEAIFRNVKVGDTVRLKVDFSEPYRPINPNFVYTIPADGRIHLTVALQNLGRVFGTVIYQDQPLEGVLVDVEGLRTTTDITGRFEIQILENAQRKDPEVKFLKKGFKMMMKIAYPQTDAPLNVVMEKLKY